MSDDTTITLYGPDAAHTAVSVDDGSGPATYTSDATGKLAHVDPRHVDLLKAHGFATERAKKTGDG